MKKMIALCLVLVLALSMIGCSDSFTDLDTTYTDLFSMINTDRYIDVRYEDIDKFISDSSSNGTSAVSVESASVSWANWSDDSKIRDLAFNKDTFFIRGEQHIPIYKCDSIEELTEFKTTFSDIFTLDGTWDEVPSFEEVTADYTKDFFAENILLLVYVEAGSCTPRFGVDSISKENGTLSVYVTYTYNPEEGDTAMAGWLFTIPVSKNQIQDCTNFDAVLK